MKKITTKKSINAHLPRHDWLHRNYMHHGETRVMHGCGHLEHAYIDIDAETGECIDITLYATGEARTPEHYNLCSTDSIIVYDITELIEGFLTDENPEPRFYGTGFNRSDCVDAIYQMVNANK